MVGAEMLLRRDFLCVAFTAACWVGISAQSGAQQSQSSGGYTLQLPVDEVVLTFNAEDAHELPINDLKAGDIRVWDNGAVPRRIVVFDDLVNRPLRVGILLDTSESMQGSLPASRAIAEEFAARLFRQASDEAFVSDFGYASDLVQPWTGDVSSLLWGIEATKANSNAPGGTALFNAVYRACSSSFEKVDPTETGNFLLLFSDGEDNAGLTSADEAARACQRSNTQIFAFLPASAEEQGSTGPKALRNLAAITGGRVFRADDSEEAIWKDLKAIESEVRNQYRLVYNPDKFRHDGAFHEILLQLPDRVSRIEVRSGYFAPSR